jgi:hypothetical protein
MVADGSGSFPEARPGTGREAAHTGRVDFAVPFLPRSRAERIHGQLASAG